MFGENNSNVLSKRRKKKISNQFFLGERLTPCSKLRKVYHIRKYFNEILCYFAKK